MGKTIAEELREEGRREGRKIGEIKARRHTLLLLLRTRFSKLPQAMVDANPSVRSNPDFWVYVGQTLCIP